MRLFRHLLGALASVIVVVVVYVHAAAGWVRFPVAHAFAALVGTSVLAFTACIASGVNRRFGDPSLTAAQLVTSGVALAYLAHAAPSFRQLQLPFYMVALSFGAFRLPMRQQVAISAYFVATFGAAAVLSNGSSGLQAVPGAGGQPGADVIPLVLQLALLLLLTSLIGGHVNDLRRRLQGTNSALKQALEKIERIATYDELTSLYNRRIIREIAAKEQKRAARNGAGLCIAMVDADHFKAFNDRYGHSGGDHVLRTLSSVLLGSLRETEYVGRYGGEEFMVVLPGTTKPWAAIPLERLRAAIAATAIAGLPPDARVTVSIGAADHRRGEKIEDTIARADAALYEAKRTGRDKVVWSEP